MFLAGLITGVVLMAIVGAWLMFRDMARAGVMEEGCDE
jgi:hypothetical protein